MVGSKKRTARGAGFYCRNAPPKPRASNTGGKEAAYHKVPCWHGQICNFSKECVKQDSPLLWLPTEVKAMIYQAYFGGRVFIVGRMRDYRKPFNAIIHHDCPQPRKIPEDEHNYLCCMFRPECPLPHFHADGSECDSQNLASRCPSMHGMNTRYPRYHRPCGCLATSTIGISFTCQTLYQETMTEGVYKYTTFMLWPSDQSHWPRLFCPDPHPKWDDMLYPNQRIFRHGVHRYIRRVSLPSNMAELLKHLTDEGWTLEKLELEDTHENPLELLKVDPTLPSFVFKLMFLLRRVKRVEVHWIKLTNAPRELPVGVRKAREFFKAHLDDMLTDLVRCRPPLQDGEHLPDLSEFGTMDVHYRSYEYPYQAGKRSNDPKSCFPSEGCEVAFRSNLRLAMKRKGVLDLLLQAY
jgi:hypothetical protein